MIWQHLASELTLASNDFHQIEMLMCVYWIFFSTFLPIFGSLAFRLYLKLLLHLGLEHSLIGPAGRKYDKGCKKKERLK